MNRKQTVLPRSFFLLHCFFKHFLLFTHHQDNFFTTNLNHLILWETNITKCSHNNNNIGPSWGDLISEGRVWIMVLVACMYRTDFSALAANVNNNHNHNHSTRDTWTPASTKGFIVRGGWTCTLCIEGFMESFYLFSYCILNVTHVKKRIFKRRFFPPPPPQIVIYQWDFFDSLFFFWLYTTCQAVYVFLMNQTSMMLYYCMHFNFFFLLPDRKSVV